jgi:hypothetical protein
MRVRIPLSGAVELDLREMAQPEIGRLKLRMLPGEDQRRRYSARMERLGNSGELDRFGTSADDNNYSMGQPSP